MTDEAGAPIRSAAAVTTGDALAIAFADGKVDAIASGAPGRPKAKGKPAKPAGQGSLF